MHLYSLGLHVLNPHLFRESQLAQMRGRLPEAVNPVQDLANSVQSAALPQFRFLSLLHNSTVLFRHLQLLPDLVTLYDWLNDTLAFSMTMDDVLECKIGSVFRKFA